MTDKRTLIFPEEAFAFDATDSAIFWAQDGDKRIKCRISREALDDHFSDNDKLRPEAAFKKYRTDIEGIARRKYLLDQIEADASILIRTEDIG